MTRDEQGRDKHSRGELSRRLVERTLAQLPEAQLFRRELHANPCLSGEESAAAEWIAERMPVAMHTVATTGRIGRIGPGTGPTIAIRAELDALPMTEATGSEFASVNGAMHACGHDVHQAALIAVARAAAECELPYALVPFLQPREEAYPSGASDIVSSGAFERQSVAAVLAAHVHPRIPVGAVATGTGPTNAAADEVRIVVRGQGGHGAYPHEAGNPITVLARIAAGCEEVLSRNVSPMHPVAFSIGRFQGGDAANVIPEIAVLEGTLRTMHREDRERVHRALERFAIGQAESFGAQAEVVFTRGEPVLENDAAFVARLDERLTALGFAVSPPMRSCGADDFSFISERYPGVMAFVGVDTEGVEPQPSLHHPRFLPDEDAVRRVALTLIAGYLGACDMLDDVRDASRKDTE